MRYQKRKKWLVPFVILMGGVIVFTFSLKEDERKNTKNIRSAMAVEIMQVEAETAQVDIQGWGVVEPREHIDIVSKNEGYIVSIGKEIIAGASLKKGDKLFAIDDRDYKNAVMEAEALYVKTLQALEIEKGRQRIARVEYKMLQKQEDNLHEDGLALRVPQLKEKAAELVIAKAKWEQAKLDLERSTLLAPCNGQITDELVAEGKYVRADEVVLSIACLEDYYIQAKFSSEYEVRHEQKDVYVMNDNVRYVATLETVFPQLDRETRQRKALVKVSDANLVLGEYVRVELSGRIFENVYVLPRSAVRSDQTVWVLNEDNKLEIRPIKLAAKTEESVFVSAGISNKDRVILTYIATPIQGMELRLSKGGFKIGGASWTGF